jgi:hypothetical protein
VQILNSVVHHFQYGIYDQTSTSGAITVTIANSVLSNNGNGLQNGYGVTWLAKTVISGNATGVFP